ncbi:hypothetical protein GCM10027084_02190 [Pseudoxanthomonas sangjuensis]|uniref:hypothetical protein n=1 Tax=Pseudoxanthomonas sangjuensis TaxID=1503750 RepID=UPI00139188C9|nr:hypothetical protein [Pseudoxanthomonas sangjuensis]
MDWKEGMTFGVALLGAVLGVINTVWALYRDRVRLRVRAVWLSRVFQISGTTQLAGQTSEFAGVLERSPDGHFGVRVTNLGFVEVTIDSMGLTSTGFFKRRFGRRLQRSPIISDAMNAVSLPYRLKPRETITVWTARDEATVGKALAKAKRVYASTSCGVDVFGASGLLRALVLRERQRG